MYISSKIFIVVLLWPLIWKQEYKQLKLLLCLNYKHLSPPSKYKIEFIRWTNANNYSWLGSWISVFFRINIFFKNLYSFFIGFQKINNINPNKTPTNKPRIKSDIWAPPLVTIYVYKKNRELSPPIKNINDYY